MFYKSLKAYRHDYYNYYSHLIYEKIKILEVYEISPNPQQLKAARIQGCLALKPQSRPQDLVLCDASSVDVRLSSPLTRGSLGPQQVPAGDKPHGP